MLIVILSDMANQYFLRYKYSCKILLSAIYFNAIMLMVAASVVTTILVLNYHHRLADTHEMPDWVSKLRTIEIVVYNIIYSRSSYCSYSGYLGSYVCPVQAMRSQEKSY